MPWNSIIGQERIKNILQRAVLEERTAHAYCLWGDEGTGKEALALEFAKMVNCEAPVREDGGIEACGECKNCRQAARLQHGNIELVFAVPAGDSSSSASKYSPFESFSQNQMDELRSELEKKSENPYHKIRMKKASQIKIASIRELKRKLSMPTAGKGRRVVIIFEADKMTPEASNAFLKQLEEPRPGITIFMITSRRDMILPTILSRCQQLHCPSISEEDLTEALIKEHDVSEVDARLITNFAQGSYSRAEGFLDESFTELRQYIVEMLRTALKKRNFRGSLLEKIDFLAKNNDKKGIEIILQLLIIWLRDALAASKTGGKEYIINIDQADTIGRFAKNFGEKNIFAALEHAEKAIFRINRNVQIKLILLALFVQLRGIFLGRS